MDDGHTIITTAHFQPKNLVKRAKNQQTIKIHEKFPACKANRYGRWIRVINGRTSMAQTLMAHSR